MGLQQRLVSARNEGRIGERTRVLIDGPGEHELVVRGRLATQAPDIDGCVYLTDCDPSQFSAGVLAEVIIAGAHEYDLVARPAVEDRVAEARERVR